MKQILDERKEVALPFTTIDSALQWLGTQINPHPRQGFDRLRHALAYFNNPQHRLKTIHITGTNGKGSVTAFLRKIFAEQGYRVGSFTSPHIMAFNERIALNGESISDSELLALTNEMRTLNDYLRTTEYGEVLGFELYTVMACVYFARKETDVVLLEVGIGGLLDCTNVIDSPLAIITTVGLDHVDKLGSTLEEVAYQKAGIIKQGATVITGRIAQEAQSIIQKYADCQYANVIEWDEERITGIQYESFRGMKFSYQYQDIQDSYQIKLLGKHQVDNACVALTAFIEWQRMNECSTNWSAVKSALYEATWSARTEILSEQPLLMIDGAHNHAGLMALNQTIQESFKGMRITLLYSGLSTKDQLVQLRDLDNFKAEQIILTEFEHFYAIKANEFEEVIQQLEVFQTPIRIERDWKGIVKDYLNTEEQETLLLVTGSLYFVSSVRQWLQQHTKSKL